MRMFKNSDVLVLLVLHSSVRVCVRNLNFYESIHNNMYS